MCVQFLFGCHCTGSAAFKARPSPCGTLLPDQHFLWGWHSHVHAVERAAWLHERLLGLRLLPGHSLCSYQPDWTTLRLCHGAQSSESAHCLWLTFWNHCPTGDSLLFVLSCPIEKRSFEPPHVFLFFFQNACCHFRLLFVFIFLSSFWTTCSVMYIAANPSGYPRSVHI